MQDIELARFNMIEQQIRPCEVLDTNILDLFNQVKRENFVPADKKALAFSDLEVPLGHGQKMWEPKLEARALQELQPKKGEKALEIGTGSGHLTALLAQLVDHVTSVEIVPALAEMAKQNLQNNLQTPNYTLEVGDGSQGWGNGHYDVIILTGSVPMQPEGLQDQLADGGRLFIIEGEAPVMTAKIITRAARQTFVSRNIMEACIDPLQNSTQPEHFEF